MPGCLINSRARALWISLFAVAVLLLPACVHKEFNFVSRSSSSPAEALRPAAVAAAGYRETGIASWYGKDFQGKRTSSGDIFDMYALSAAHRTLPLGTMIRVTNLDNFKTITVKINDRGPFVGNRILELSYGAARELGFAAEGTAHVKIETEEQPHEAASYTVLAAVFAEEENARLLKDRLSKRFEFIAIVPIETNLGKFYRVRVGSYGSEEKAELIAGKLKLEGLEPLVLRKD